MHAGSSAVNKAYEFGPFRLDPLKRVLLCSGEPVALTPKVFETLLVLVQNCGRTLSRDELMGLVWPDSFVEEGNLTQNISVLRKSLRDGRYIVTVPGRGYQFVEAVREVEEGPKPSEKEIPVRLEPPRVQRESPRRPLWAAGTLVLVVLAALAFLLYRPREGVSPEPGRTPGASVSPAKPARRSIAVLGFRNLSGRRKDQWLSTAFAEMLNTELAAGNQLRLISGEDVARARHETPLPDVASLSKTSLQQLQTQLGSDLVVLGSYTTLREGGGERLRFDLRLQDANSGETLAAESVTGTQDQLFQLVTKVGAELRQDLGVAGLSTTESAQVGARVASNTEATRLYAEGLDKLRSFDALGARDLLEKAVAADPRNALFHSSLAQSWSKLGYDLNAQAEARKAFELSSHASRADQLLVEGYYRELTRNFPAAIEIYRTLWNFFPDDLQYGLLLAAVQTKAGMGKDALDSVARMRRLGAPEDQDPRIDLAEAEAAESVSDFKRTVQASSAAAGKAERQGSRLLLAEALHQQGYAYQRQGRPADAIAAYQKAHSLWAAAGNNYGVATALHMIALAEYYRGNFDASQRAFEDALAVFRRIGAQEGIASCSHNYAMLLHDQGKLEEARKYLETALRIQRGQNNGRGVAADLDDLGNVLLGMGELAAAADLKREAVVQFHGLGNGMGEAIARGNLGDVLLAQGKLDAANQEFEKALALKQKIGFKQGLIACWMDLASVLLARDQTNEARKMVLRALALSQQLGNEFASALSRLQLAQISLEQGKAAEAETLARSAAAVFDKHKVSDSGAMAYAALSRALLQQGKAKEAETASSRASKLSQEGGDLAGRFEALLAAAAVDARTGQTAEAERQLQAVYFEARRRGYTGYELQARLRLGELAVQAGHSAGHTQLLAVQREAEAEGFLLMARQAGSALQKRSSPM